MLLRSSLLLHKINSCPSFSSFLLLFLIKFDGILTECRPNNTTCNYTRENYLSTCEGHVVNTTNSWKNIKALRICDYQHTVLNLSGIFRKYQNLINITILGGNIKSVIIDEELVNNMKVLCSVFCVNLFML